MTKALWTPSEKHIARSEMTRFQLFLQNKLQKNFSDFWSLHQWSCENFSEFWRYLSEFVAVRWTEAPRETIYQRGSNIRSGRWMPGAKLNYAENLLSQLCDVPLVSLTETGKRTEFSREKLIQAVAGMQRFLKDQGVQKGDRVAGVVANSHEAVICMLATASLGAIWSSCSPDFGTTGIFDRFSQIEPKVVFFSQEYRYGGKSFDILSTIEDLKKKLSSAKWVRVDLESEFSKLCQSKTQMTFEPVAFDHPLFILFSSGTTGAPKCIVHGHGGTLLQHKKELILHSDLKPNDKILFYTTCGWMMWNWLVSALSCSAQVILYDGSPALQTPDHLWKIASSERVTHLGTSPKYIGSCMSAAVHPQNDFSKLRVILSTGSPLLVPHFEWVYQEIKPDVHLASISGGTDIVSCFMLGNPNLPVYPGEIQCFGLGMDVVVWDENQKTISGEKGELICRSPFVSMPVSFWNDSNGSKYAKAYFEFYPGVDVWRHGDFIALTKNHGIIVYGRSDATLNPGGVRIGTAEIYRAVENFPDVVDSLTTCRKTSDDVEIVLFVKMKTGITMTKELSMELKSHIRKQLSPRHVPKYIFEVRDIPFTRSGKKMELIVSQILDGETVSNMSSVANPECLKEYDKFRILLAEGIA